MDKVSTNDLEANQHLANYFCRVGEALGLPRSVAQIYHVLFVSESPVCVGDIIEESGLSKGSVSLGLRLLERMRFVHPVIVTDDRRRFYRPELSLRKLAAGLIKENFLPALDQGGALLEEIASRRNLSPHFRNRLGSLRHWNETARTILPALCLLD